MILVESRVLNPSSDQVHLTINGAWIVTSCSKHLNSTDLLPLGYIGILRYPEHARNAIWRLMRHTSTDSSSILAVYTHDALDIPVPINGTYLRFVSSG
jgi:hypothetical protein